MSDAPQSSSSGITEPHLHRCPFCKGAVRFRKALWPSDGNVDAIIHVASNECGLAGFADGSTDESIITKWNAHAQRPASSPTPQIAGGVREALEPLAAIADLYDEREDDNLAIMVDFDQPAISALSLGHCRAAKAALSPQAQAGESEPQDLAQLLHRVRNGSIDAERDIIEMFSERRKELAIARSGGLAQSPLNAIQFIALLEILGECAEHVPAELKARISNVLNYHSDHDTVSALASPPAPLQAGETTFSPGDPVEVRLQNEEIDEIVIRRGDVHIEQMDDSSWFLGVNASDGSYHQFWFGAKNRKSHVHFRHTETVASTEGESHD